MSLQTLGYIGLRTKNLEDWTAYASRFLGMQLVDKSRGTASFRMDDKKQRLVVHEDAGDAPGFFGWEVADARGARRLRRQSRTPQGFVRARLPRARRRAQGPRPDRAERPGRQSARDFPRRRDHHRSVQARPRHLRLPHRPARHGPRRAPLREDRRHPAVLPRHPRLPAQRLLHQAVRGVFLPRQSAPPQRRLHRVRQGRHPSPDGRDLLSRRRRPVLRHRAEDAGDDRHHVRPALQRPGAFVLLVVAVEVHVRIRLGRPHHRHRELDARDHHPGPEPVGPRALLAQRSSSATKRASFAFPTPRRAIACSST